MPVNEDLFERVVFVLVQIMACILIFLFVVGPGILITARFMLFFCKEIIPGLTSILIGYAKYIWSLL